MPAPAQQPARHRRSAVGGDQLDERRKAATLTARALSASRCRIRLPITDLLLMLVQTRGSALLPDPDVQGTSARAQRRPLRQALEMILQQRRPLLLRSGKSDSRVQKAARNAPLRLTTSSRAEPEPGRLRIELRLLRRLGMNLRTAPDVPGHSAEVTGSDDGDIFSDLSCGGADAAFARLALQHGQKAALLQATDYPDRLIRFSCIWTRCRTGPHCRRFKPRSSRWLSATIFPPAPLRLIVERAGDACRLRRTSRGHLAPALPSA